jgi:hypothetical protein
MPTADAAIARFCGLIILPITPPEELAAASSSGSSPARAAVCTCSAEQRVGRGVRAGHGHADPAEDRGQEQEDAAGSARNAPSVFVWPDWLST